LRNKQIYNRRILIMSFIMDSLESRKFLNATTLPLDTTVPVERGPVQAMPATPSQPVNPVTPFDGHTLTEAERNAIKDRTKGYEGSRSKAYEDTEGNITVGVGHNMGKEGEDPSQAEKDRFETVTGVDFDDVKNGLIELTQAQIDALYNSDFQRAENKAKNEIPNFDNLPLNIKTAILDLTFNLGSLSKFTDMKEAISRGDWQQAAWDLMHKTRAIDSPPSDYAGQVGQRAIDNENLFRITVSSGPIS
jgi:GH24 family phage-related lysozyme (muramidase)